MAGQVFRYTNRQTDLQEGGEWKAGDSWDQHYSTVTGFDDRDSELEVYLATSVTTRQLVLLDVNGTVVAELGTGVAGSPQLTFKHNDALTTDSYLYWTQPDAFGAGFEELVLSGPEGVGAAGVAPALILSRSSPSGVKLIQMQGAENIVAVTDAAGSIQLITLDAGVALNAEFDILSATSETVTWSNLDTKVDVAGVSRGSGYGNSFQSAALGSNTNLLTGGVTLLQIVTPNYPVAGTAVITFSALIQNAIAANRGSQLAVNVDGVNLTPAVFFDSWAAVGSQASLSGTVVAAMAAGSTHTISLVGACQVANNSGVAISASGTLTGMNVTNYL